MRRLPKIADYVKCTGCTACMAVCPKGAITMLPNEEGFLYPKVDSLICIMCRACERVCPVENPPQKGQEEDCYAAFSWNPVLRENSSSGGIFTEIAHFTLEEGGCVFGCGWEYPRLYAIHRKAENADELSGLRGSKYVQSDLGNVFKEIRALSANGKKILFCGTPCQIAGLKNFLAGEDERVFFLEIICHSVPSPKMLQQFIRIQEDKMGAQMVNLLFRSKENGARWDNCFVKQVFDSGEKILTPLLEVAYIRPFLRNMCARESCYQCCAKRGRSGADMTIGDFWGIQEVLSNVDDGRGISVVIVHTSRAVNLIERLKEGCFVQTVPLEKALKKNPFYSISTPSHPWRKWFMRLFVNSSLEVAIKKLQRRDLSYRVLTLPKRVLMGGLHSMGVIVKRLFNGGGVDNIGCEYMLLWGNA